MPTDKKLKNLVFNVLTEEQYESATKNEDEFYLTPDNSVEIEEVIPTDVAIKDNKLGLKHDSVWLTNQNAINLGEGLTYDEATKTLKASGGGGKSVSPTLVLFDMNTGGLRTTITEEEYNNLVNGLYSQVTYADNENAAGFYMPNSLYNVAGDYIFAQFVGTIGSSPTYSSIRIYSIVLGEKNASNEYPITVTKALDFNPASSGSGFPVIKGTKNASLANAYTIPAKQTSPFILHIKDDAYNEDIYAVVNVAVDSKNRCDYYAQFTHNFDFYRLTGTDTDVFIQKMPGSNINKLNIEFTTNGNTTLTSEQVSLIKSYANQYVYVKLSSGLVADNAYIGYVFDLGDLGTFISIVSQPNISGNIIIQSLISIKGTTATHKESTIVFSSTNSGKFLKTNAQGNPEWASIPTIPALPSDASTSTYVLKAVNGTIQWVKES